MLGPLEQTTPQRSFFEGREILAATLLSIVWIILLGGYGAGYFGLFGNLSEPRDAAFLEITFFLVVLVLPLSLVWLGVSVIRRSFQIQNEARQLEQKFRELQSPSAAQNRGAASQPRVKDTRVEALQSEVTKLANQVKNLETDLASLRQSQSKPAALTGGKTKVDATRVTATIDESESSLDWPDLLRALNFPRNEKDAEGFKALRLAKRDEDAGQLLRAAEDILNQLSQEGIYMDDFRPIIAPAYEWRAFAEGARGNEVAGVGGINVPEVLDRISERKKNDQIFRDTSLHFLRRFDIMLKTFTDSAGDAQIQQLADTRTGRAFMLIGRAADMFD